MEVTAFHRNLIRSSLWPYSSPHGGRPLTVTLLYGVRTFLPPRSLHCTTSGCLAYFKPHSTSVLAARKAGSQEYHCGPGYWRAQYRNSMVPFTPQSVWSTLNLRASAASFYARPQPGFVWLRSTADVCMVAFLLFGNTRRRFTCWQSISERRAWWTWLDPNAWKRQATGPMH